ncbi:hypothetical protein LIN78_12100 [Leeia sp. TBRC 13508]|uniref:Uncharacterized protein n=1 Tax=Leeia speluncae TaxID=2884804 RepID=A0ABS8D835_9NEIS|nr:hypothetical protein [Leeia speluncae]MCB6184287.1 hypothetical protein [Leeia speluncae]
MAQEDQLVLTEKQLNEIAERAAKKTVDEMTSQIYAEIGKGVVKKGLVLMGCLLVALWYYFNRLGVIK